MTRAAPLTHAWIWSAIDAVARQHGLSPSGLARLAGLDPTAFNRSKRFTPEGRPRWPSTESLSKLLEATGMTLDAFAAIEVELPPLSDGIGSRPAAPEPDAKPLHQPAEHTASRAPVTRRLR